MELNRRRRVPGLLKIADDQGQANSKSLPASKGILELLSGPTLLQTPRVTSLPSAAGGRSPFKSRPASSRANHCEQKFFKAQRREFCLGRRAGQGHASQPIGISLATCDSRAKFC